MTGICLEKLEPWVGDTSAFIAELKAQHAREAIQYQPEESPSAMEEEAKQTHRGGGDKSA